MDDIVTWGANWTAKWHARCNREHRAELAKGLLHDPECEWREAGHFLCHCSKRRRIANGHTEPPGELIINYPTCPRCRNEVTHDGDSYVCDTCSVSWNSSYGDEGEFTDDYGDLDTSRWDEVSEGAP